MATPVWQERTVRKSDGLIRFTGFKLNERTLEVEKLKYTNPDVYTHFLLNKESDEWEMRVYDIPSADDEDYRSKKVALARSIKRFNPSLGWAKNGKVTVVKFFDDGVARPWMVDEAPDLDNCLISMSLKTSKYMSMFSQQTYLNRESAIVFVDEDDEDYYDHINGVLFVKITTLPEDEAYLVDGHFFVRPEVRDDMIEAAYLRILPHDEKKAKRFRKQMRKVAAFNGRLITSRGTIKGDTLVSYALRVDVQADAVNVKRDIRSRDVDTGLFQMFPQEQYGEVFTNRQMVASFYDSLLDVLTPGREGSLNLVFDAMIDYRKDLDARFASGEPMLHVDSVGREAKDNIYNAFQKMEAWTKSFSMNESLYLLMAQAGQVLDMHTPPKDKQDKKRRLPVPYATRHSIRNAYTYYMVYGIKLELEFGEAFVDPDYGVIMSDDTYRVAAPIWGGADLDDHVELHYRVAHGGHEFFGIKHGDIVMVGIRNPIGIVSNSDDIGTEYYVLKAHAIERIALTARYGELPALEMAELPLCSAQVELPEPKWTPEEPEAPEVYSMAYLEDQIQLRSLAQAAYGMHVNLYLTCRMYNIPFDFVAPEEDIVDLFQQKPYTDGLLYWEQDNARMQEHIARAGIPLDYWVKKRIGLGKDKRVKTKPGVITDIVNFHANQIDTFELHAQEHLAVVKDSLCKGVRARVTRWEDDMPILLARRDKAEYRYREANDLLETDHRGRYIHSLSYEDFERIGTYLVDRLEELEATDRSKQTREMTLQDFREAHAWLWTQTKMTWKKPTPTRSMYYNTDQKLMAGRMFDLLMEALLTD